MDPQNPKTAFKLNILLDDTVIIYSRTVYSILFFLGDLGGLSGVLIIIGSFLTSGYVTSLYNMHFIATLLKVSKDTLGLNYEDKKDRRKAYKKYKKK